MCTFTNSRANPTLTIVKAASNGDGVTAFDFTSSPSIGAIPSLTPPANGSTQTGPIQLTAGTSYSLTENTPLPQGWSLSSATCSVNGTPLGNAIANGVNFTPTAGQTVVCTFTNMRTLGSLTLTKVTLGGDGSFGFSGSGSTTFVQSITTSGGTGTTPPIQVNFGSISIEETIAAGFNLTSITCNGGSPVVDLGLRRVTINVASTTLINCTFTNQRRGMHGDDPQEHGRRRWNVLVLVLSTSRVAGLLPDHHQRHG